MDDPIHIAITRRVREEHVKTFERLLEQFAARSLMSPGARGVYLIYPTPGSVSREYGILRSFASAALRDAFHESPLYKEWTAKIEPMTEGGPIIRQLDGLEAWFREPHAAMPPRWKMATLTWLAVWPASIVIPPLVKPWFETKMPTVFVAGIAAAGMVVALTWVLMPVLVKLFHPWLKHKSMRGTPLLSA